jgi:nucleotide-binding universal stress UspA family protein
MFEKILVPTDFSKHAGRLVECVGEIPGVKEVVLLNVISRSPIARVWDPVSELKEAEERLTAVKTAIAAPEINVKVRAVSVIGGEVAGAISKVAEEEKVSLIAMGARGRSRIQSALLGSVSRNVLRFGNTHLLVMRYRILEGGEMQMHCSHLFSRILFPTDFSEPAEAALSFFKSLPGIGELVLLNVVSTGETDEEINANVASAMKKMDDAATELMQSGIAVTSKVVVGHPVEEIRSVAEEEDVSVIAMSSQGAVAIKKGRIGSTAYDVANSATRPVLVLRRSEIAMD